MAHVEHGGHVRAVQVARGCRTAHVFVDVRALGFGQFVGHDLNTYTGGGLPKRTEAHGAVVVDAQDLGDSDAGDCTLRQSFSPFVYVDHGYWLLP